MIRKVSLLSVAGAIFLYTAWLFYQDAIVYDPLHAAGMKKQKLSGGPVPSLRYRRGWVSAITEKNLFSPARMYREPKPVKAVQQTPPPEPPRKPDVSLKGVILDSYGEYVAFVEIDRAKAVPMRKGDKTENLELVDISDRQVVLQWNDEKMTFTLDKVKTILTPRPKR